MKLYLVQHAEACAKEVDPKRPLSDRGQGDIERMAKFLKHSGIRVERVIHSGKLRARQTAECLAAAIAPQVEIELSGLIDPNDNPKAFDWQSQSWSRDTLIVGHLPFMSKFISHLIVEDENRPIIAYQPGSVVCLQLIEEKHWQINWMIRPDII